MKHAQRGAIMIEHLVITIFFSILVYYALVGAENEQCFSSGTGSECVSGGMLSQSAKEGAGFYAREYFDNDSDGMLSNGKPLPTYAGVAQSLSVKQKSFSQRIYQP